MVNVRAENLRILAEAGFNVAPGLPLPDFTDPTLAPVRPKREILGRLLAIKTLWLWVDTHPDAESEETVRGMIANDTLREHLTPEEAGILDMSREAAFEQHADHMGWKNENCWSLAWMLGFAEPPSVLTGQLSGSLGRSLMLEWLPNNATESTALRASCSLRPAAEIARLEDLFYCAHNAVRSAQLGNDTVPDGFDPLREGGCIHERRHSLTWAISPGVAWDDTDLST